MEAKLAAEAIADFDNQKQRNESQRKKREQFLQDLDTFSTTFETKNLEQQSQIQQKQEEYTGFIQTLDESKANIQKSTATLTTDEIITVVEEDVTTSDNSTIAINKDSGDDNTHIITIVSADGDEPPSTKQLPASIASDDNIDTIDKTRKSLFDDSLDAISTDNDPSILPPTTNLNSTDSTTSSSALSSPTKEDTEETVIKIEGALRVPTRIGPGKTKTKKVTISTTKSPEDDEEEGTGTVNSLANILTKEERNKLTSEQKQSWRAKQADLTKKRKDFHGVVTFAFDGVFSWQMYGSAEAIDETGAAYTEYLMRCQWGLDFDSMKPWIVAHRFREFDFLDQFLKRKYPQFQYSMPQLPAKSIFGGLESQTVSTRRVVLEDYMGTIIVSMPTILRSSLFSDFLDIKRRISNIKIQLEKEKKVQVER